VHFQGETAWIDQQPDLNLRAGAVLLAHSGLAQVVLLAVLEVQGRDVVEDQGRRAGRAVPSAPGTRWPGCAR
jgi:hypothetical protein